MEEACTFIVSNFLRCKGRNNIVKCKNILLLNKTVRKVLFIWAFAKRPYITYRKSDWLSE